MSKALQLFSFQDQPVRMIMINGEPWWVAADVCAVLDIRNVSDAVEKLDGDEKNTIAINDGIRGNPNKLCVNEFGLYGLIFTSRKSEAEAFRRWLKHEVLPSIRKTGGYSIGQEDINEAFRLRRDENKWLIEKLRFTVDEKTNIIAIQGHLRDLDFADNAFLDTSLGKCFYPWCEEQGYDMSLVRLTEQVRLVGWELNEDGTYNFDRPIHRKVHSYPENPFGYAWARYLVECYWPEKFLPYIKRKYRGEERARNIEAGMKVIGFYTGLQITEKAG
jgi:prophage antirepressor-like protein